jgi:hypothetical protein
VRLLRLLTLATVVLAILAPSAQAGAAKSGFYVYKDLRTAGVIEFRDAATGRLVSSEVSVGEGGTGSACGDSHHTMAGARWKEFEPYLVNNGSTPSYLSGAEALADLRAAHAAWTGGFATDCRNVPGRSEYRALYGGTTVAGPSLGRLEFDGVNAVAFRSLEGTVCAGPGVVACVVAFSKSGTFTEADMVVESDLSGQLGGDYRWTTGDTTAADSTGGELALVDVATHEFGHWAGLGHVKSSPELTMFPAIRDGMQTLGLGDMKGLLARY